MILQLVYPIMYGGYQERHVLKAETPVHPGTPEHGTPRNTPEHPGTPRNTGIPRNSLERWNTGILEYRNSTEHLEHRKTPEHEVVQFHITDYVIIVLRFTNSRENLNG